MMIIERLSAINAIYARIYVCVCVPVPYNTAICEIETEMSVHADGL